MSMALSDMVDQLSTNSAVLVCSSRRLKSDGGEETIPVGFHRSKESGRTQPTSF